MVLVSILKRATCSKQTSRVPGLGCSPFTQEVEGLTPTGGTCPTDFSNPVDQDIRIVCALSWKILVSEWGSVIAVSLNVDGGMPYQTGKTVHVYAIHYKHNEDARRRVCVAVVPYC